MVVELRDQMAKEETINRAIMEEFQGVSVVAQKSVKGKV